MNFLDYFTKGLGNTLKFKNRANFSFKGEAIPVINTATIDTWFLGDFSSVNYEIVAEFDKDNVEHLECKVVAHANQASVTVYNRSNTGKDLINISAVVDNGKVQIKATAFNNIDNLTPLTGIKVTFKATYSERLVPIQPTPTVGESSSLGGQSGTNLNWSGTNLPNGSIQLNDAGSIVVAHISTIQVPSQPTLASKFIFDTLTIAADPAITITTSNNNSISFNLNYIKNLNVTGTFAGNPSTTGSLNNVSIGGTVPLNATFTNLTAGGNLNISGAGLDLPIVPLTGLVTIGSGLTGSINNVSVGATTPRTGAFTSLSAQTSLTFASANQTVSIVPTGTAQINSGALGSINNTAVGTTVPASGRFTSITINTPSTAGNALITRNQLLPRLLLGAVAI